MHLAKEASAALARFFHAIRLALHLGLPAETGDEEFDRQSATMSMLFV